MPILIHAEIEVFRYVSLKGVSDFPTLAVGIHNNMIILTHEFNWIKNGGKRKTFNNR